MLQFALAFKRSEDIIIIDRERLGENQKEKGGNVIYKPRLKASESVKEEGV